MKGSLEQHGGGLKRQFHCGLNCVHHQQRCCCCHNRDVNERIFVLTTMSFCWVPFTSDASNFSGSVCHLGGRRTPKRKTLKRHLEWNFTTCKIYNMILLMIHIWRGGKAKSLSLSLRNSLPSAYNFILHPQFHPHPSPLHQWLWK